MADENQILPEDTQTQAPPVDPSATETVHVSLQGPFTKQTYELDVPSFDPSDPTHLDEIKNRVREVDAQQSKINNKQLAEKKREFWTRQDSINNRPGGGAEAAGLGIADTALAGTPEALARLSRVPQSEIDATKVAHPFMTSAGEIAGFGMPLGALTKGGLKVAQGIKQGIAQGARIGGIYGLGEGASHAITGKELDTVNPENPTADLKRVADASAEGGAEGVGFGTLLGGLGGFLGGYKKNVMQLGEEAKNYLFEALKAGRGTGEGDPGKYMKDMNNAFELITKDQGNKKPIQNLGQLNEVNQATLDQKAIQIDKDLTKAGKKGIFVPGSEMTTEYVRNALFPQSFQKQLSSSEVQNLDEGINALMKLKGRSFSGQSLDGLASALLNHQKFASIPKETRIGLVNEINKIDRDTEQISGDQLMSQGLRGLKPSDTIPGHDPGLNFQEPQIQAIVSQSDKFGGAKQAWTPWELEDRIQKINDEIAIIERKVPEAAKTAQQANPDVASLQNEQNVLRTKLDEVMSSGPNGEFRKQKSDLGTLMRLRRVAQAAQLSELEGKGKTKTEGWKGMVDRAKRSRGFWNAAANLVKTDKDLSPSERVAKGFESWALSKRQPSRIGRAIGNTTGMKVLEGLKKQGAARSATKETVESF